VKTAAVVDVGVSQVIVVAGRATEVRDAAQRRAERAEHQFLAAGKAIEQGQGEAVALDRGQLVAAAILYQSIDQLLRIEQIEALHLVDQHAGDGEAAQIEAQRHHAATPVALRGDLAGAGTAYQADATEVRLQRLAEPVEIVFGRTEEQHEAEIGMDQLTCQFLGGQFHILRAGDGAKHALRLFQGHITPQMHLLIMGKFYEGGRRRPMLLEYWVVDP